MTMFIRTTLLLLAFLNTAVAATLNVPSQYGSITSAMSAAQPGDTILLAAGSYLEDLDTPKAGTSGARIIIDGQNVATIRKLYVRYPYWTFKNMSIVNNTAVNSGVCVTIARGSHFTRIENCIIDPQNVLQIGGISWTGGSTRPFSTDAASDCVITGCTIRNINNTFCVSVFGDRNIIENCVLTDLIKGDFFRIWGRDNLIRKNLCENNLNGAGSNHPDCFQTFGNNGNGAWGNIIDGNIFNNVPVGQLSQLSTDGLDAPNMGYFIVRNNLFMNIGLQASCHIPSMKYYNNVFYRCNYSNGGHPLIFGIRIYGTKDPVTGEYISISSYGRADNTEIKNNVFVDCGDSRTKVGWYSVDTALTGCSADYNLVIKAGIAVDQDSLMRQIGDAGGWDSNKWYEPHGKNGVPPLFLDLPNKDARFQPSSPLKDSGLTLALVPTDRDGTVRPLGTAYDIGMYESGGSAPVGNAPVVAITVPTTGVSYVAGSSHTYTATATDTEDGNIASNIVWASSLDGAIGTGGTINKSLSNVGAHTITASVTDSDGRVASTSIVVNVTSPPSNTAPTVTITSPYTGQNAVYADEIEFTATATDTTDGTISSAIVWISSIEGVIGTGSSFFRKNNAIGSHTITASVTDSGGLTSTATAVLNISKGNAYFGEVLPLTWDSNNPSENVTSYRVYERRGDPGQYSYIFMDSSLLNMLDFNVQPGSKVYVVTAVNSAGESSYSAPLSVEVISSLRRKFRGHNRTKLPLF